MVYKLASDEPRLISRPRAVSFWADRRLPCRFTVIDMGSNPATVVRPSPIQGVGVFATRPFGSGERVLTIDDTRVVDQARPLLPGESEDHCDHLADGTVVLIGLPERHINHACDPNVFVKTEEGCRHVVARREIAAGEELTYDYIIDCHDGDVWVCECRNARCRGTIVSSFFELPDPLLREYLPLLNPWFVAEHRERIDALRQRLGLPKL